MNRYDSYKDSGVDWLGEVPSHWEVKKLKYIISSFTGFAFPSETFTEEGIPLIRIGDLLSNGEIEIYKNPKLPKKYEVYLEKYGLKSGDILFAMTGGTIGKVAMFIHNTSALLNQRVCAFRIKDEIMRKVIYYWMISHYWKSNIDFKAFGGAQPNISDIEVLNLSIVLPPLSEQTAIAQYLDNKTAKIDRAIELEQQQIELLKERKQIVIQTAVTRGLNPDVALKDSGVEWLGEVPEHWGIDIGMNFFKENKRSNKGMKENTVLSLSYGNIIIKPEEKLVGLVPESFETYQIVEPNDIIIRCTDLQNDQTSLRTGLAKNKGIITGAYLNLQVINGHNAKFLHYFLHSLDVTKVLYKFGSGLRQNLSFLDFKRLPILSVPLSEQTAIAHYLDEQTAKIDHAISIKLAQIEKLKEYKTVLINEVVTGKRKVVI